MCWGISTPPPPSPSCLCFFSTQRRPVKGAGCQAAVPNPFAIPSASNHRDMHPVGLSQTQDTDLVPHSCRGYLHLQHPCRTPSWQGAATLPLTPSTTCRSQGMGREAGAARGQQGEDPAHSHPGRTNSKKQLLGCLRIRPHSRFRERLAAISVRSAPPLPELQERVFIKKKKKEIWRNKKSPAHTLLSRKEIKCLGGGGGVEEREGGSSAAWSWQGRCEEGGTEHPHVRGAGGAGRTLGTGLGVTPGLGDTGTGYGAANQWQELAGMRSNLGCATCAYVLLLYLTP